MQVRVLTPLTTLMILATSMAIDDYMAQELGRTFFLAFVVFVVVGEGNTIVVIVVVIDMQRFVGWLVD